MARDRPSPYGEGVAFFIGARGPSDAIRAGERVSPAISIVMMCVSPSVVCDRLITNGSGSGDPALQGLARERWLGSSQVSTRAGERVSLACVRAIQRSRGTGPRATVKKNGTSPEGEGLSLAIERHLLTMEIARDRPPRYGKKNGMSPEGEGLSLAIERATEKRLLFSSGPTDLKRPLLTMMIAGDRPPRYGEKTARHRRARACPSPSNATS